MELLAKDLNKNPKLKSLHDNKKMKKSIPSNETNESNMSKLKRSTSNPFLYFNERRDQIMEVQPVKGTDHDAH